VHARFSIFHSRWEATFLSVLLMLIGGAMILLPVAGCQSPEANAPTQASAKPNFGPPMQDVRTEERIAEMEAEYNADKNSQPTHHAEAVAEAEKKKQEQQKLAKEKAAQDAAQSTPEPAK
jgi:hypothetical protein